MTPRRAPAGNSTRSSSDPSATAAWRSSAASAACGQPSGSIESGTCPDFKVKYIVSRLSDAEAALVNLSENIQREDPKPIQLAHAVRALTEDYGLTMKQVAGRLKRSEAWLSNLLNLVMLPTAIQESVANGKTPVSAALELTKLPTDKQVETFNDLAASGEKVTAAKVKAEAAGDARGDR